MSKIDLKTMYKVAIFFVLYELSCYLSNDMIMPAMPEVVNNFHAPLSNVALSLTLYIIGGSTLQVFLAPITDVFGKRKVFLFGIILFLIASSVIPFSKDISLFLLARYFQGMGMCFIFISYAMINEEFNDEQSVKLIAIMSNIAIFAPLIGPVIGSAVVSFASWKYIFVVSIMLGLITLIGIYKFMPKGRIHHNKIVLKPVLKSYKNILFHKNFMFGMFINGVAVTPVVAWIGISPIIILEKLHQPFSVYLIDQAIMFAGFIFATFVTHFISGKYSFYSITKNGGIVATFGILFSSIFYFNHYIFVLGLFIFSLGFGVANGIINRIILTDTGETTSLTTAIFSLVNGIYLALGLELYNRICGMFDYSLKSFAYSNIVVGFIVFFSALKFAKNNRHRQWK